MGTRALIFAEDSDVVIYRHWDGYPDGVLPELEPIVKEFFDIRGHEPDMLLANICYRLKNNQGNNELLGYRLFSKKEAKLIDCIEYSYIITKKGKIKVKDV